MFPPFSAETQEFFVACCPSEIQVGIICNYSSLMCAVIYLNFKDSECKRFLIDFAQQNISNIAQQNLSQARLKIPPFH